MGLACKLCHSPLAMSSFFSWCSIQVRFKTVKVSGYVRPARASPTGQAKKAHIGIKRLSAEYVYKGQLLVKQRKFIAHNPHVTRNRHFKIYPGEFVGVSPKTTSLFALANGRVKYTHHLGLNVKVCNVLPEPADELFESELWRYRTEHVTSFQDNCDLVWRRIKATQYATEQLPRFNVATKPPPRPAFLSKHDPWESQTLPNVIRNVN